jgi:hypothetical protein
MELGQEPLLLVMLFLAYTHFLLSKFGTSALVYHQLLGIYKEIFIPILYNVYNQMEVSF